MLPVFTAALLLLLLAFYGPYLLGRASLYFFDICAIVQPLANFIGDELHHGRFPLWNRYALSGISQAALPNVFNPPYWFFVFPFNQTFACLLILQQLVAGVGMFLLVRSFRWHVWASCLAGFAAALNGLMFSLQPFPFIQGPIAWFFLCWYFERSIADANASSKLVRAGALALCIFLMITSATPEISVPAMAFLCLAALADWHCTSSFWRRRARVLLALQALALLLGLLLSSCALLPMLEWARLSQRFAGLPVQAVFAYGAGWYDIFCTVCPQPLGNLYDNGNIFRGVVATQTTPVPFFNNEFVGPIIITIGLWGLGDRTWRQRFLVLVALLFFLLIALSGHLDPIVRLVEILNLRMFRFPIKAMTFAVCAVLLLSARGMHVFAAALQSDGNRMASWCWCTLLGVATLLLIAGQAAVLMGSFGVNPAWCAVFSRFGISAAASAIVGLGCVALWNSRLRGTRGGAALIVASCVAILLGDAFAFNDHKGPPDFYNLPSLAATKIAQLSKPQGSLLRAAIIYEAPHCPASLVVDRDPIANGYACSRQLLSPMMNMPFHIANVARGNLEETGDHALIWQTAMDQFAIGNDLPLAVACRMSSAGLLLCQLGDIGVHGKVVPSPLPDGRLFSPLYLDDKLNLGVFKVIGSLPRLYFAPTIRWASPHRALLDFLRRPDQSNFDPGTLTVLEHNSSREVGPSPTSSDNPATGTEAAFLEDTPNYIAITATTGGARFLVLTDQFYPGWRARIDGRPTEIFRANGLFRAVLVPAGKHLLEFQFSPASVKAGVILNLAALAIIASMMIAAAALRKASS